MPARLFNVSHDLLAIVHADGSLGDVNDAWTRTLGWTRSELVGVPYLRFVHPEDCAQTVAEAERITDGQAIGTFRNRYRRRDGDYVWLDWRASLDVESGCIVAAARDVNELVTLHRRLASRERLLTRVVRDQLHAAERERRRIAHELHDSVLQHCIGARLLLDQLIDPAHDDADGPIDRARAQVSAGIDATRCVMQGIDPFNLDELDLAASLRALADRLQAYYGIPVELDAPAEVRVCEELVADAYRAVQEAAINAAKHADPGRIRIGMCDQDGWLTLTVDDDGSGFDQAAVAARASDRGSGLGLALMRERVDALHGAIDVASDGSGTRVVVRLPLAAA